MIRHVEAESVDRLLVEICLDLLKEISTIRSVGYDIVCTSRRVILYTTKAGLRCGADSNPACL